MGTTHQTTTFLELQGSVLVPFSNGSGLTSTPFSEHMNAIIPITSVDLPGAPFVLAAEEKEQRRQPT